MSEIGMHNIYIIVPVYNAESFLNRCIDSILLQYYSSFRLILVDDGSTDRSGEICDRYAEQDDRIVVLHRGNGGQAAAKNTGIEYAYSISDDGWITFIDSDDWVHPQYLEALLNAVKKDHTEISVCDLIKTDGKHIFSCEAPSEPQVISPEDLWVNNRLAATVPVCKLFSKDVFRGFRFPEGKVHEDEFLMYRPLFSRSLISYIDSPLYYYYQNTAGITLQVSWNPARADCVTAFSEQCSFFREHHYPNAERVSARALICSAAEALYHLTLDFQEETGMIRACRKVLRKAKKRYGGDFVFAALGGKIKYERLARPVLTKFRRKVKHGKIFIGRIFHA